MWPFACGSQGVGFPLKETPSFSTPCPGKLPSQFILPAPDPWQWFQAQTGPGRVGLQGSSGVSHPLFLGCHYCSTPSPQPRPVSLHTSTWLHTTQHYVVILGRGRRDTPGMCACGWGKRTCHDSLDPASSFQRLVVLGLPTVGTSTVVFKGPSLESHSSALCCQQVHRAVCARWSLQGRAPAQRARNN